MFEKFVDLFINRRGWVAIIPAAVIVSQLFGVEVSADLLESTGDKIVAAIMGVLSLASLYWPRKSEEVEDDAIPAEDFELDEEDEA